MLEPEHAPLSPKKARRTYQIQTFKAQAKRSLQPLTKTAQHSKRLNAAKAYHGISGGIIVDAKTRETFRRHHLRRMTCRAAIAGAAHQIQTSLHVSAGQNRANSFPR